jgi:hypothetical protein
MRYTPRLWFRDIHTLLGGGGAGLAGRRLAVFLQRRPSRTVLLFPRVLTPPWDVWSGVYSAAPNLQQSDLSCLSLRSETKGARSKEPGLAVPKSSANASVSCLPFSLPDTGQKLDRVSFRLSTSSHCCPETRADKPIATGDLVGLRLTTHPPPGKLTSTSDQRYPP